MGTKNKGCDRKGDNNMFPTTCESININLYGIAIANFALENNIYCYYLRESKRNVRLTKYSCHCSAFAITIYSLSYNLQQSRLGKSTEQRDFC